MTKKIVDFMTTLILILVAIFSLISLVSCKEVDKGPTEDSRQKIVESIKDKYTHDVFCFSHTDTNGVVTYYAYWTVPNVTVHLDGTETVKDMIQVHRYNVDGEYAGMTVAYTLEDAIDMFDKF